jgi:hypothetical protein
MANVVLMAARTDGAAMKPGTHDAEDVHFMTCCSASRCLDSESLGWWGPCFPNGVNAGQLSMGVMGDTNLAGDSALRRC